MPRYRPGENTIMTRMTNERDALQNGAWYEAHTNGLTSTNATRPAPDWRHAAMERAMLCRSEDATPWYALMASLKTQYPERTVCFFREARPRTLAAFATHLQNFLPVLQPFYHFGSDNEKGITLGWWHGTAPDGAEFEIVLSPCIYGDGEFLVCGPSKERVEQLTEQIIEDATKHTSRCLRFMGGSWEDAPEIEEEASRIHWDDIILPPALISDIQRTIGTFFQQRDVFHRLGFAWRRGVLLVGPPGTGKTMICKAVAQAYPTIPFLYVRDVVGHHRDGLTEIFSRARRLAPCILAIEDMDGLINKSNRTTFLNELDGFKNNDGMLLIASSNHPEQIDEALLKRPSRFDRVYHIGLPEVAERTEYCRRLLAKSPMPLAGVDNDTLSAQIAAATDGFTPAFLKEAILSAMLAAAQEGFETLDEAFGAAVLEQVHLLKTYLKKARNPESFAEMTAASGGDIGFRSR